MNPSRGDIFIDEQSGKAYVFKVDNLSEHSRPKPNENSSNWVEILGDKSAEWENRN